MLLNWKDIATIENKFIGWSLFSYIQNELSYLLYNVDSSVQTSKLFFGRIIRYCVFSRAVTTSNTAVAQLF